MSRIARKLLTALMIAAGCLPVAGCGKDESKPNPDLQVPDIPAGGRDTKGKGMEGGPKK
jgi:hypothetical protein